MKLGKKLDLNKCIQRDNDGEWIHPGIKEKQVYIVETKDYGIQTGTFYHWTKPYADFWQFHPNGGGTSHQLTYGRHPKKDGWKSIQEVIK